MTLLLAYVALALGVSFLCSIMEAVLLSISPSYLVRLQQERPRLGNRLAALKETIDRPLAAILSLNTVAHTVGAAGAGAQAVKVFGDAFMGIISAALTLLILVLSEILPKTLGAVYWRELVRWVVPAIGVTIVITWPLVWLSDRITRLLTRDRRGASVERSEFLALAESGAREGILHHDESRILLNVLRFRDVRARDIMTPRTVVFALPEALTVREVFHRYRDLRFSRIPVHGATRDDVTGFVLRSDLLTRMVQGREETPVAELRREIPAVPGGLSVQKLFERLLDTRVQIALVIDEYGGMEGIVTLEDLIETLLGLEIVDEGDRVQDMQELARREWRRRAGTLGLIDPETGAPGPDGRD